MAQDAPELAAHKEWLGQIQQVGLVVSPHVLVRHNVFVDRQKSLEVQSRLAEPPSDFPSFATAILDWPADLLRAHVRIVR